MWGQSASFSSVISKSQGQRLPVTQMAWVMGSMAMPLSTSVSLSRSSSGSKPERSIRPTTRPCRVDPCDLIGLPYISPDLPIHPLEFV